MNLSKIRLKKVTYISFLLLFISSQTHPDNFFKFITYISTFLIHLICFFKVIYKSEKQSKYFYYLFLLIIFLFLSIFFQYESINYDLLRQIVRVAYPWYLTLLFTFLLKQYEKSEESLFNILNFTSFSLYLITLPDIVSIFGTIFSNPSAINLLKSSTLIYVETNTTAFFIVFAIIFRNELKLATFKEHVYAFVAILVTLSRSSILLYFGYLSYKLIKKLYKKKYSNSIDKYFSRIIPLISLFTIFLARFFIGIEAQSRWSLFSLRDSSFLSRLAILDYIGFFIDNIRISNLHKFFLGFGWVGKEEFSRGVMGTSGHTILGSIPELGIIYMLFIILFFYKFSWRGQIAEAFILSLSLTIFIPFTYAMPIYCLTITKAKYFYIKNKKLNYIDKG